MSYTLEVKPIKKRGQSTNEATLVRHLDDGTRIVVSNITERDIAKLQQIALAYETTISWV